MNSLSPRDIQSLIKADYQIESSHNFNYRIPTTSELVDIIKVVHEEILKDNKKVGLHRLGDWQRGWQENLEAFRKTSSFDSLNPLYYGHGGPLRMGGSYIFPEDKDFELNLYRCLVGYLFQEYLRHVPAIYEVGCGSGHNLAMLATMYPDKEIIGLDFSQAAVDIANEIGKLGYNVRGEYFDITKPKGKLIEGCAVLTIGSLEQVGTNHSAFFDFLLKEPVSIVIHIEPILEWYKDNLTDILAINFHEKRGYLNGLTDRLAKEENIHVIKAHRAQYGGLFIDGHSQIIWKKENRDSLRVYNG